MERLPTVFSSNSSISSGCKILKTFLTLWNGNVPTFSFSQHSCREGLLSSTHSNSCAWYWSRGRQSSVTTFKRCFSVDKQWPFCTGTFLKSTTWSFCPLWIQEKWQEVSWDPRLFSPNLMVFFLSLSSSYLWFSVLALPPVTRKCQCPCIFIRVNWVICDFYSLVQWEYAKNVRVTLNSRLFRPLWQISHSNTLTELIFFQSRSGIFVHSFNPSTRGRGRMISECESSLDYTVSSNPGGVGRLFSHSRGETEKVSKGRAKFPVVNGIFASMLSQDIYSCKPVIMGDHGPPPLQQLAKRA